MDSVNLEGFIIESLQNLNSFNIYIGQNLGTVL